MNTREHPIASVVSRLTNDVAGLLATHVIAVFAHRFEHMPNSDCRLNRLLAISFQRLITAEIALNGRDDCVLL